MRLAIYGGSFNPPHLAHVMACVYVLSRGLADQILMIPCARHAFNKDLAPFEDRLAMCKRAVEPLGDRVDVSDLEAEREGVSYMVDTLEELAQWRPEAQLVLVVGSDIVADFEKWKDADRIRELSELVVIPRLGPETLGEAVESGRFVLPELSSESIRKRLHEGRIPDDVLPRSVADYIRDHGLYQSEPIVD